MIVVVVVVERRTESGNRAHGMIVGEEGTHITGGHKYLKYVFTDEYIKPGNLSLLPDRPNVATPVWNRFPQSLQQLQGIPMQAQIGHIMDGTAFKIHYQESHSWGTLEVHTKI